MNDGPEHINSRTVAESRLFRIEQVDLRFSNGVEAEFERLTPNKGRGAVLVVALTDDERVLMVREYAVGTERYELGLPKGRLESDEAPEDAARRELREEVGYDAARTEVLRRLSLAPGYIAHQTTIILARALKAAPLKGDEPETLEVVAWPLNALDQLLGTGHISEARSIAALYLARSFLQGTTAEEQA